MDLASAVRARFPDRRSFAPVMLAISLGVVAPGTRVTMALAHGSVAAETPSALAQDAETLTQALASAGTRLMTATGAERSRLEQTVLATATRRRELVRSLIESDPGTVLRLALPSAVRAMLPPQASGQIEEPAQLDGTLEIFHEDSSAGSRDFYHLNVGGTRYGLHFAGSAPGHLQTGATVRVHGTKLDSKLALAGGGNSVQTISAAPTLSSTGEQRTLVMLVNFYDNVARPWSPDQVSQAIFGTMNSFIAEASYGAAWVSGDVTDWMTLPLSAAVCDTSTLASQAQQAAKAAGWAPGNYSRWIYAFPRNACDFGGASYIGGSPSQSWLNGAIDLGFAGHEFGHQLGLWHSRALNCGTVTIGSSCTYQEYGDRFDIMGTPFAGHFNAFQKERLAWLGSASSPPITTVVTSGTYQLDVYELRSTAPKALKVLKSTDPATGYRTWYYIESRQAVGFDAFLAGYANPTSGVLIHIGSESTGNSSYLLDMTPASSRGWYDAALVIGQTFADDDAGATVTTEAVTATGATVAVDLSSTTDSSPPLTTSLIHVVATNQAIYKRGQTVFITSTVTSGGSPVPGVSVTFTITKPSGSVLVTNGTTSSDGTVVTTVRLKKQDPVGTYQVGAVAKIGTLSATATTQFVVQ